VVVNSLGIILFIYYVPNFPKVNFVELPLRNPYCHPSSFCHPNVLDTSKAGLAGQAMVHPIILMSNLNS